jgi:hypothetical protein
MNISRWWGQLDSDTQTWLIEHNGEPLSPEVEKALRDTDIDDSSWAEPSSDGVALADEAIDWIEAVANGETAPDQSD